MEQKEIIFFRESLIQSILADTYMFGTFIGMLWLNKTLLGNHGVVAGFLMLTMLVSIVAKSTNKNRTFTSKEELIKHLKNS